MAIRKMKFSDLKRIVRFYQSANLFAKEEDIYNWTKKGLENHPDLNLVYEKEKKVLGAISAISRKNKEVIINDIAVQRKHRGKTIGTQLMKKIMEVLKNEGVKKITLWVHWSNAAAIPFYYQFGFRVKNCTKTKNISGVPDGEDILYLEKVIDHNSTLKEL